MDDGHEELTAQDGVLDPFRDQERYVSKDEMVYDSPRLRPPFFRSVGLGSKTLALVRANDVQGDACRQAYSSETIGNHDFSMKQWLKEYHLQKLSQQAKEMHRCGFYSPIFLARASW